MRVLWLTLCVIVLDQATKFAVKGVPIPIFGLGDPGMSYGQSIPLLGEWLKLTYIENPNMAFGFEVGGKMLLTVFAVIASVGLVWYLHRHRTGPRAMRVALALILAGAIGNLIDRVFYGVLYGYGTLFHGNVVDFIDFDIHTIHFGSGAFKIWPIFNIADSAVTIGVLLLLFLSRPRMRREIVVPAAGAVDREQDGAEPSQA
jgi:signal peptidase II